jgi:hypothetical protein
MDMSYETIPIFGEQRRLYRETRLAHMVSSKDKPNNHPIYVVDIDIGSSIFYHNYCCKGEKQTDEQLSDKKDQQQQTQIISKQEIEEDGLWTMDFDGVVNKEGARAGVWVRNSKNDIKLCSFKLYFDWTNNVVDYEALILGLNILKNLKGKRIDVYGDSKLVIN